MTFLNANRQTVVTVTAYNQACVSYEALSAETIDKDIELRFELHRFEHFCDILVPETHFWGIGHVITIYCF